MAKKNFTNRGLKALEPADNGKRYEEWDAVVPGLGIRITDNGTKTFMLMARYPGSGNPTRRALGEYGAITLEDARAKARKWRELIQQGKDPAIEEEKLRQAELRKQENTFSAVAEAFIKYIDRLKLRTAPDMERDLRGVFIPRWEKRPIADIASGDVRRVIEEAVSRDAPYTAFKLFALIRRLFNWAIGTDEYGLEFNPCDRLNTRDLIGERQARQRTLTENELRALWRVTGELEYPYGPLYRILLLTGLRLNEACGATWSEIDLERREWTIPASRMKKIKGGARPHVVPLTDAMVDVLATLPRFTSGEHLFSHSYGKRPLKPNQFSDIKRRLDGLLLTILQEAARDRGEDPKRVTLPDWVNHDLRRTVRTHLSALRIADEVREAVLAHVRPGIKGVYDKYEFADEKREALTLWNARLRNIVEPPPANVVPMKAAR
jgi:integrase